MKNHEKREMERFSFIVNRSRRLVSRSDGRKNGSREEQEDPRQIDPLREEHGSEHQLQFNWPKR